MKNVEMVTSNIFFLCVHAEQQLGRGCGRAEVSGWWCRRSWHQSCGESCTQESLVGGSNHPGDGRCLVRCSGPLRKPPRLCFPHPSTVLVHSRYHYYSSQESGVAVSKGFVISSLCAGCNCCQGPSLGGGQMRSFQLDMLVFMCSALNLRLAEFSPEHWSQGVRFWTGRGEL